MKKNFKDQFDNLKKIIDSNVEALKGLISQSESLQKTIDDLEGKENCADTRQSLISIKTGIHESIGKLIKQTGELFETYDKLVDEVFK